MTDRIIGCPHEEGIDYEGSTCRIAHSGPGGTAGDVDHAAAVSHHAVSNVG